MTASSRHHVWALATAALAVSAFFVLRNAGRWLIVDEPTGQAQAVVVLGGDTPFRAMEAADVYRERLAPEVWLTKGEFTEADAMLRELGVEKQQDFEVSRQVLLRLGVPESAIRVLPDETPSTIDEVRLVARELTAQRGTRVIFVTSKYHGRRVKTIWGKVTGAPDTARVRVSRRDPSDPVHWWRHTTDSTFVWREWFGILNALAAFPMAH